MLSRAQLSQLEAVSPAPLKQDWFTTTKLIRSPSISSAGDAETVKHNVISDQDEFDRSTDIGVDSFEVKPFEAAILTRQPSAMTPREVSTAMSVVSKRDVSFSSVNPLYDTQAIWKPDPVRANVGGLPIEIGTHIQKALDRYIHLVGQPLEYKRSVTSREFLEMVTNERLRYMPTQGSKLDKVLKKAEAFAKKFDTFMAALQLVEVANTESSALVLSSCKILLSFVQKFSMTVERFFSALDQTATIIVQMADKVDTDVCSDNATSVLQSALAMVVDMAIDMTANIKGRRQGASEKTIIVHFEPKLDLVLARLIQLRAEFQMELLARWLEIGGSKNTLLIILRGLEFGLDTCPPSYIPILIEICQSLHSHNEPTDSLPWLRLLWASFDKHRHDCEVSTEKWFEVFQDYIAVLEMHESLSERIRLAIEFRDIIIADFSASHHFYVRVSIDLAKLLELDEFRYREAVEIYEEICQYDIHIFEEREAVQALIDIAKYRLSVLFETHVDLAHRAQNLLIEEFISVKIQFGCAHEKALASLARVIEYYRKQKRRESITAAIKVIEEYIVELLIEERNETVLFNVAKTISKMYRELSSVEFGIKFLHLIREDITVGERGSGERCGFKREQIAGLDRRCFVFIQVLEQMLCGYEREGMLDEIIRDIFAESCLFEAYFISMRQTKSIHRRLASGARLLAFLELKGREVEMRRIRTEMWETFRAISSRSITSESLWQLFELSLANATKKTVSISLLELLVNVTLEFFATKDLEVSLELLQWAQIYFKQLIKAEHAKVIELAFRISGSFSGRIENKKLQVELHRISSEILVEVLKSGHLDIDFGNIPVLQLNVIIRLLGQQKNFSMLERILQYLWDTRMGRSWSGATTVATGKRLCEVKFAAGHQNAAISLLESICYNLRDVYGSLHKLTVECETLCASFHNTFGNHMAARDIHVHLLEEVAALDSNAPGRREDLTSLVVDQAKRLKWACHLKVGDDDKAEAFYSSVLRRAQKSISQYASRQDLGELQEAMAWGGEKRETKWTMPEDWSLPIDGEM